MSSHKHFLPVAVLISSLTIAFGASATPPSPSTPSSTDSWAGSHTYNLKNDGIEYEYTTLDSDNAIDVDGVYVGVSTWSDTDGNSDDKVVYQKQLDGPWKNNNNVRGYGLYNEDLKHGHDYDSHYIDNFNDEGKDDFDMVLFSFSEAVTLTGSQFSHVSDWDDDKEEVTVVGLNSLTNLIDGNKTWSDVKGDASFYKSFNVTKESYTYYSTFDFTETAKYWLIGAYNSTFSNYGDDGDDFGMKLAAIGFTKQQTTDNNNGNSNEINAPATLGMFGMAMLFLGLRKRRLLS